MGEPVTEIPPLPTCEVCGVELVIGERALPTPLCGTHEAFQERDRLRNEMAAIRLFFGLRDDASILDHLRARRETEAELKAQRDMLMEATGPCVSDHARRLRDLEAKVKELHETLDSHGIYRD